MESQKQWQKCTFSVWISVRLGKKNLYIIFYPSISVPVLPKLGSQGDIILLNIYVFNNKKEKKRRKEEKAKSLSNHKKHNYDKVM